ncbi:hypothetical protein AGMMS49983_03050 [Clostridia bacterium]|nr:hypothetical protein AGMMS49983_03050 [Clostridia bacterium]
MLAAGGYAPIGGFVLSGDVTFNAVVDSGPVPGMTNEASGMTIGALGNDGDDDTRDDSDADEEPVTSGDGSVIAGADPQSIQALGEIGALGVGTIANASIAVLADGEGPFDSDDTAGNDSGDKNGIVRNNDHITYKLTYEITTAGDVTAVIGLPEGMEWDLSALVDAKTGSSISDDGKLLTLVREVKGNGSLVLSARVYNHTQGQTVTLASAEIGGVEATGAAATTVTVSAVLNYRVTMGDNISGAAQLGSNQDASHNYSSQAGYGFGYGFGIYAVIDPDKDVKGIAPLDSCTFEVNTTVETAISAMWGGATYAITGLPSVFSGSQSYAEKGLVNTHTITATGFDTSFKNPRVTTAYGGGTVRADAYYVKTFEIVIWAPSTSLSTTGTTPNTTTLLSKTAGLDSGTPGDESFADDGMRNSRVSAFPRLVDYLNLIIEISSISGINRDLHRGETFRYDTFLNAGAAMPPHSDVEFVATWDESLAAFDSNGSVTGTTINGVAYTVYYGQVSDINDPSTFASATWSTTKPTSLNSGINAVKLVGSSTATIPAAMITRPSIPLVVKRDAAVGSIPFHSFYTSDLQSLTRKDSAQNINAAGIDVVLKWENNTTVAPVQTPGALQILKLTPWVAGNHAGSGNNVGTYNSRPYLTPTEGTAENLQVVVTIPNAAYLSVDEAALQTLLNNTYSSLTGATVTSDTGSGSTVLTFNFGTVTHNGALPTLDIPVVVPLNTTVGTRTAKAVISSPSDNINQNYRESSSAIAFNALQEFAVQKTADKYAVQSGDEVTWTLNYANFTPTDSITSLKLVDVLPYPGDGRGTTGLTAPLEITAASSGVEYTTEALNTLLSKLAADKTGGTGITWESDVPASGVRATAVRFDIGTVPNSATGSVSFTTKIGLFQTGGVLNNNAYVTCSVPMPNAAAAPVVSTASDIAGIVYDDKDFSGAFNDMGTVVDELKSGVTVTLTTADPALQALLNNLGYPLTAVTNADGEYRFENLPSGDYTVSAPAVSTFPHFRYSEPAGTNIYDFNLAPSGSVTRDFGLQATRWNLSYDVNTPVGSTTDVAPAVTLPAPQTNISTASASAAVGAPANVPLRTDGGGVYIFAGWATTAARANTGTVDYVAAATVPAQAADTNYVLYAVWTYTATTWDLVFDKNIPAVPAGVDGSAVTAPASQLNISTANASANLTAPSGLPTAPNGTFVFAGWNTAANGGGTSYAVGNTVPKQTAGTEVKLYAQWTYTATSWNLTYDANQPADAVGTPSAPANQMNIPEGSASAAVGTIGGTYQKSDGSGYYTFDGWASDASGAAPVYTATQTVEAQAAGTTKTLYAVWTFTATTWDLVYGANAPADATGSPVAPAAQTNIPTGSASAAVGTISGTYPKSDGSGYYTFNGWASDASGAAPIYSATQTVPAQAAGTTKTIYGTWNFSLNSFDYTITHHFVGGPNGGTSIVVPGGMALFGQTIVAPTDTVYTGYTHNAAHPSAVLAGTVGVSSLALHLYYQAIPYIITFDANGGELNTGGNILFYPNIDYGTLWSASGIAVPTATRSGYTFIGWSPVIPDGSTAITDNAVYTAQWTDNSTPPPPPPPVNPPPVVPVVPPVVVVDTEPDPDPVPPPAPIDPPDPNTTVTTEVEPQVPDAPAPEIILNDQARLDAQTGNIFSDLANGNVPLGSFFGSGAWSLLSLILSLIAVIVALLLLVRAAAKRRERRDEDVAQYEDEETKEKEERRRYTTALRITTIIIGFLVMIVWLILDNLSLPMVWINKWTLFVAVVFLVHIIFLAVYRYNKAKDEKEDGDDEANGSQPMTA